MASPPCFLLDASGWFCKWLLRRVNRCAWSTPYYFLLFLRIYPKSQIKANGTIVATINVVIRVVTYIVRSPPASYPSKNWFTEEDKYLYIFVSIIGVLGAPVGLWLSKHINQTRFKMILACILIINGVTMIVTGSFDL